MLPLGKACARARRMINPTALPYLRCFNRAGIFRFALQSSNHYHAVLPVRKGNTTQRMTRRKLANLHHLSLMANQDCTIHG